MNIYDKIAAIKIEPPSHWFDPPELSYWGERAFAEIATVLELSKEHGGKFDALANRVVDMLYEEFVREHSVPDSLYQKAEEMMAELSPLAKENTLYCVAHAHLDMDWMWGYHETVSIVTNTFRTMLDLMKEYPDFTFSQSQAATYEIVEKYDPEMFEEIKARIREGRWEFAGSAWVELDKNLPSGESMARHILYTKRYLHEKLDIPYEKINLDFHPDSFGHSISVPEVFAQSGIRYFYHCRGLDGQFIYRWRSQSGAEVLAYNEPLWYNDSIRPIYLSLVPEFCHKHGIHSMMKIYGVGDHGGGPTRKDIEQILDMQSWPLAPTIKFSTYSEFFRQLEPYRDTFPVLQEELGPTFTGCYTSESRIKTANRISEDRLYEAEALTALSVPAAGNVPYSRQYRDAWRKTLFNQFHDILPGSGVQATKDHCMGMFEEILGAVGTGTDKALRSFAREIDTSAFETPDDNLRSRSEGGGGGIGIDEKHRYGLPSAERGRGRTRILHFFNPTQYPRKAVTKINVWDWYGHAPSMELHDLHGRKVEHQFVESVPGEWNHLRTTLLAAPEIPPFGYTTLILSEGERESFRFAYFPPDPRRNYFHRNVLENEYIRAELDSNTMEIISLTDKTTGKELAGESGHFVLSYENGSLEGNLKGGSAWVEGIDSKIINLNREYKVFQTEQKLDGSLRQSVSYFLEFLNSRLEVTVSLDKYAKALRISAKTDWHEISGRDGEVPVLRFRMGLAYAPKQYRYDIQFGNIDRAPEALHDWFGRNYICGLPAEGEPGLALLSDTKYGYRGFDSGVQVSILRASSGPNKYPELGERYVELGLGLTSGDPADLLQLADEFIHAPAYASNTAHPGRLPLTESYVQCSRNAGVSCLKNAEDDPHSWILRVYNLYGESQTVTLNFAGEIAEVIRTDFNEIPSGAPVSVSGKTVSLSLNSHQTAALKVKFA